MPDNDVRYRFSLPADDPRFDEMRAVLARVKRLGQGSPVARMLGEWALLGFLMSSGKIAIGGGGGSDNELLRSTQRDLADIQAAQAHLNAAMKDFDFE